MSTPFVGQISMFGFNFAPRGWAICQGQLLAISQNTALFSLLGTNYGGDGRTTFGLPDLQGRMPMNQGNGTGRSSRTMGQAGGTESVTLMQPQMPSHSHNGTVEPVASTEQGDDSDPTDKAPAVEGTGRGKANQYSESSNTTMLGSNFTTNPTGGNQPHENMPPFQVVNFCIALQGIYPSRN